MVTCPNCGKIEKSDLRIHHHEIRKQNIKISPIIPVCNFCGTEVAIQHTCSTGNIIILNGTCGSGKSSVAEILQDKGFLAIDGDCVVESVRHKKGVKQYEWNELINEIACEIDILSLFGNNFVLSHVVLPEDLDVYIKIFESRNLKYSFILLKPDYQTAVERCQTRTCHSSITPEKWIRYFYDTLTFNDSLFNIIDNTNMTEYETTEFILKFSQF